jgi:hypothetical protein
VPAEQSTQGEAGDSSVSDEPVGHWLAAGARAWPAGQYWPRLQLMQGVPTTLSWSVVPAGQTKALHGPASPATEMLWPGGHVVHLDRRK